MSVLEDFHRAHKERQERIAAAAVAHEESKPMPMMLARIQKAVSRYYNVPMIDLMSRRKTAPIVVPRQVAMYLCKTLTTRSLPEIGRSFRRDHTTVLHAVRIVTEQIKADENLADQVNEITKLLQEEQHDVNYAALEADVSHACRSAWMNARELEGYRRHLGARRYLKAPELLDDLEKARDYISRVLDDMRGVK